jgi:nicotinate-nucleotide pyrophosphorylase (carboxylating)
MPGLRLFDKWAVRIGGGQNHRFGLYDMILVKDNHINITKSISQAVLRVRNKYNATYPIEIEVRNIDELEEALALTPDRILLDNMNLKEIKEAVRITNGKIPLEVSGSVTITNVKSIAQTGVKYISVGALTHSAAAVDISLECI